MRKKTIAALAVTLVLSASALSVSAAGRGGRLVNAGREGICGIDGGCYVDADNDGRCDNYSGSCNYVDADSDGRCDNYSGSCNYVDVDNDGRCDNCGSYFVDVDGDGICDYHNGTGCQNVGNGTLLENMGHHGVCGSYTTGTTTYKTTGHGHGCGRGCGR